MTVTSPNRIVEFATNGSSRDWPFDFLFYEAAHIRVLLIEGSASTEIDPSDYVLTFGAGNTSDGFLGGTITYPAAPAAPLPPGKTIRITREVPYVQTGINLSLSSGFDPRAVEREIDKLVMLAQQARDRAIEIPDIGIDPTYGVVLQSKGGTGATSLGSGLVTPAGGVSRTLAAHLGFGTVADLLADTTIPATEGALLSAGGCIYEVAPSSASDAHLTTAGGVKLYVSTRNPVVTPRYFGAAGDGTTDDLIPLRRCWDFGGANRIPVDMEGLEYNASDAVFTSSNLTVYGRGAVMYITAWPSVGGFINNVRPVEAERVQSNIRIYDLVTDGSKLPAPGSAQNSNLGPEFGRGASNVRVVNCTARKIRVGQGAGTGGAGFGGEQGLTDVIFEGCVAEDCYRAVRVAGITGEWSAGVSKEATGIVFRDFTARRCEAAVFCHSTGDTVDNESDLGVFDVLFDGLYIEDCGHAPWLPFDFGANPLIPAQKSGVIVFGGAQNVRMRGVRVKINSGYPASFTDWLGRTGYPVAGSSYIGAGLSGTVGALVWGWGRNIVVEDITLDGNLEVYWKCARAIALGEMATVTPTGPADSDVRQIVLQNIRHVRPGVFNYVFDGSTGTDGGLDNAKFSAAMTVVPSSNPAQGIIGPNGASTLANLMIEFRGNNGLREAGNAVEWLAAGNARPVAPESLFLHGGIEVGGGYSPTGARAGMSYSGENRVLRSSAASSANTTQLAFYNPSGLVGQIQTSGASTIYTTTSDARLKSDLRDFDALALVRALRAYDFRWPNGERDHGLVAQEAASVIPAAVSAGDSDEAWAAKPAGERVPWSIDYARIVPILIRAIQQLLEREPTR